MDSPLELTDEDLALLGEMHDMKRPLRLVEAREWVKPDLHGPTWRKNGNGDWDLPAKTLGWQIVAWCSDHLLDPDDPEKPWNFSLEQLRFMLWWYAVDGTGQFVYRKGVLQRLKGWGKDPLLAVICVVEFIGPCRFAGWTDGEAFFKDSHQPIGAPHPRSFVQVAATNLAQTQNTTDMLSSIIGDELKAQYGIKMGAEIIRANQGRSKIRAVTSNPRALEGNRVTFAVLNETQNWLKNNKGHAMYDVIDGNTRKTSSRYLAITNAFLPGEESVAEKMRYHYDQILLGKVRDTRFLYDSVEAKPQVGLNDPLTLPCLLRLRGDSVWLNVEEISQDLDDPTIGESRMRRMWLNQIVADDDALYDAGMWDNLEVEATLQPNDEIVMGFDGGKTDDDTALVAIRLSDEVAFVLGHWYKPDGPEGENWQVDQKKVDSAVSKAMRDYTVRGFFADVAHWDSWIADWTERYGEDLHVKATGRGAIGWDMRSSRKAATIAHERLISRIFNGRLHHDGNPFMRQHILNVYRRDNDWGVWFDKESRESKRKIDIYAALFLAHEALDMWRTGRAPEQRPSGQAWFF